MSLVMEPLEVDRADDVRVDVARDALAQLRADKIVAQDGVYCEPIDKEDPQTLRCECCAMGALFLSGFRLFGQDRKEDVLASVHAQYGTTDEQVLSALSEIFLDSQLWDIEDAFEDDILWIDAYPGAHERMEAILENIIRHDGDFIRKDVVEVAHV